MKIKQKEQTIKKVKEVVEKNNVLLIVHYRGMSDFQMTELRKSLKTAGSGLMVSKNTLAKLAFAKTSAETLSNNLSGPTALIYSNDIFKISSILCEKLQEFQKMTYVAGIYEKNIVDLRFIKNISSLGSEEDVKARFISILKTPAEKIVSIINSRKISIK